AGVMLLAATDRKLGLIDAAARCIADPRNPLLITHDVRDMLRQRVYGLALGWEDLSDHGALRQDVAIQTAVGVAHEVASAPTLCRLEKWADQKTAWRLHKVLVEQFIASFKAPPKELILDFDATDNPLHGQQEGRFFHGYYDCYCYLPLYVFCGQQLLCAYLRPSRIDGARHGAAILKLLVTRLRQVWPQVRIVFRGDSGFCRRRIINYCERAGVHYIVGLARNAQLQGITQFLELAMKDEYERTGSKQREIGEFLYAAQSWRCERRVITRLEYGDQGNNPRYVVTNLTDEAQALYDDLYCQRGEAENRIKEAQVGLFATRTSCQHFQSNQLRVLLAAL
ncbi:MAG: IS1380 family transposase, partial [Burkholderiales bacterium]